MTNLHDTLQVSVSNGSVPGAVGLVARGDRVEVAAVGSVDGTAPMARDSIFRIASLTKPVVAAAVMMLVEDGRIALDDPVGQWLPELAKPTVVRTPGSPVDDVVPAARPITVRDVLSSRAGHGFPSDFSLPAVQLLFSELKQGPPRPQLVAAPDEWMGALSGIPLLYQPGDAWLYNTSSDIQGVLIARVSGRPLPVFLAERLFEPLGMSDTGFEVPADKLDRFTSYYQADQEGALELVDAPDGQWSSLPVFPSGAGGLVSTLDDWHAFARMLLAEGTVGGRPLLSPESVRQMTTDQLTPSQRAAGTLFLEGQGWGFGGSVDIEAIDPWNVPGRYGWLGGTGTAAHITASTGAVTILLSQRAMSGPTAPDLMRDFWRYAAAT
ncbi:serine hydrolase [Streptomyces sp. NBC_01481]|uniref:serine hydrolase domain-containing protein n=1 Tax=Streptomyces sp. NBC_01481 TaxID=2975869 RepID=UPI00224CBF3E|nr:serine hydrolase domain-containing protein [Streptomyces sp. NBC_01481]MCX4585906.1 beta-lactamase family protein [Streptomyces sp. NBC_01481]